MNFSIAVIVCLGYFLSPVWSNGLNEDQLRVMIGLYADLKVPDNEYVEQQITKVLIESFGFEQPTRFFEYDSNMQDYVNLHFLLTMLAIKDNKCYGDFKVKRHTKFEVEYYVKKFLVYAESHEKREYLTLKELNNFFMNNLKLKDSLNTITENVQKKSETYVSEKVRKLTYSEVQHYLYEFITHAEFHEKRGYLTLQQLSRVFRPLKIYKSSRTKLEEQKSKIGDDKAINAAELLLIVLEITPEGDGLSLSQIDKFVHLYEVHETVSGNINSSAFQEVFEDLDIISKQYDLNLLLNSNLPFAKVLMDLMINAAEYIQTAEENESRLLGPGMVVLCLEEFYRRDKNHDGLLSDGEYNPVVVKLKKVLNQMKGHVKDTLTFERAHDFLKKFDSSDGIEVKKAMNFAEYMENIFFYKIISINIKKPILVDSKTDRAE